MGTLFYPSGAASIIAVTSASAEFALPTMPATDPAVVLIAQQSAQQAWWIKFGTSPVTVSVTTGTKYFPGTTQEPCVIPIPTGATHMAILCEGQDGNVRMVAASAVTAINAFSPVGASSTIAVTSASQTFVIPTMATDFPTLQLVSQQSEQLAWYIRLGTGATTVTTTTGTKFFPGTSDAPLVIPVMGGETHIAILCEGQDGNVVLSGGSLDLAATKTSTPEYSYIDLDEIASPASPAANVLRVFSKDVAGITHLYSRDSAGTEIDYTPVTISAATQAEQETGTSTTVYVSPGRQQFHPSAAKFWAFVTVSGGTPTLQTSYNVTSITDAGVGLLTVTIATDFSSANWACDTTVERTTTAGMTIANAVQTNIRFGTIAAGSVTLECHDLTNPPNLTDPASWSVKGFGDQ